MRRTIRSVACSAALVGLSSLLGACDAVAPTAAVPEAAPAASLSARVGQVQQERLREAGRSGLKRGVNYPPSGLTRSQSAPAFRVQNLRLGEAARPSAEWMALYRTKGGKAFFKGTGTMGGREPGGVGVANHEPLGYMGFSRASSWSGIEAWTGADRNITYIDVIADIYYQYGYCTAYDYAENFSWAEVGWIYGCNHGGWGQFLGLYVTHTVYNVDGYGTYGDTFYTWDTDDTDGYGSYGGSYSGISSTSDPDP
jgi:hypothetical protein